MVSKEVIPFGDELTPFRLGVTRNRISGVDGISPHMPYMLPTSHCIYIT